MLMFEVRQSANDVVFLAGADLVMLLGGETGGGDRPLRPVPHFSVVQTMRGLLRSKSR
jgi:hypothetical protein